MRNRSGPGMCTAACTHRIHRVPRAGLGACRCIRVGIQGGVYRGCIQGVYTGILKETAVNGINGINGVKGIKDIKDIKLVETV